MQILLESADQNLKRQRFPREGQRYAGLSGSQDRSGQRVEQGGYLQQSADSATP